MALNKELITKMDRNKAIEMIMDCGDLIILNNKKEECMIYCV